MAIKNPIQRFKARLRGDEHTREMLLGSVVALLVKILAAFSAFLMNVVLARKLGASEAGLFYLGVAIVTVTAAFGRMGLDNTIVRFVAAERAAQNDGVVVSVYRHAVLWTSLLAVTCGLLIYLFADVLSDQVFGKDGFHPVLSILAVSIPLLALSILHSQALQGLKRIAQSMTILNVSIPILVLSGVLLLPTNTARQAAILYVWSSVLTLFLAYFWWRRSAPYAVTRSTFSPATLLASCLPLWSVVIFTQIIQWSSQLMLGVWGTPEEIAFFASAARTAMLTSFVLIAVNSIAAPKFAAMYRNGDMVALRRTALLSVRVMLFAALPILVLMLLVPEWLMGLFGPEFRGAAPALMILALGQFVNVATGSVGYLLSMTGHENNLRFNRMVGALLAVGLGCALIKPFGLIGAAVATSSAVAVQNLLGVYQVRKVLGFNTLALWMKE